MQLSRRVKIAIAIIIIFVVVPFVIFLLQRYRNQSTRKIPETLFASDIVASNIQFTNTISQPADGELLFFTGTNLAKLSSSDFTSSANLLPETPFESVDRVSGSESSLLIHGDYNSFLNSPLKRATKEGKKWFILDSSGPRLLTTSLQNSIVDGFFAESKGFLLTKSGSQQKLVAYEIKANKVLSTLGSTPATSIIGVHNNVVVLRDYSGNLYVFKNGEFKKILDNVSEVKIDQTSGKIIAHKFDATNSEGDEETQPSLNTKLYVIDTDSLVQSTLDLGSRGFFVSRGFLVSVNDIYKPSEIVIYDLIKNKRTESTVNYDYSKVTDQIINIQILARAPLLLGVTTNFNQMIAYAGENYKQPLPEFVLPNIEQSVAAYGFDYNITDNTVSIFSSSKSASVIESSITALKDSCDCDTNQFTKIWRPFGVEEEAPN